MSPPAPLERHLEAVLQRIRAHERCALHLDYDGTLTPIVTHPAEARLSRMMRQLLTALAGHPRYRVAIISGRALADLRTCIDIEPVWLAGNHGLEIEGPGALYCYPGARRLRPQLETLARALSHALAEIPGAWVEDKGFTLTVHLRSVPAPCVPRVQCQLLRLAGPALEAGILTLRTGKAALEIRPNVTWDKGAAVRWITERACLDVPPASRLAVYIGDDETDEDAFRAVGPGGIGIRVGDEHLNSAAHYYVDSVDHVAQFLSRLSRNSESRIDD
ncbi:MAG: trehalose-phosphatase [Candidatus Entotheonellia bacterium]